MSLCLPASQRTIIAQALAEHLEQFEQSFAPLLSRLGMSGVLSPKEVSAYAARLRSLIDAVNQDGSVIEDDDLPAIREAVVETRLRVAVAVDERCSRTTHPELLAEIERELVPYATVMSEGWFQEITCVTPPRTSDYFPIEDIETSSAEPRPPLERRAYDEKFRILQAPTSFLPDLDEARRASKIRGACSAVTYIDIDEFKSVNTAHGEPFVDRHVLPAFMRKLEAHVFMRGRAYRFGGDEYVVLLYNTSNEEALSSMNRLRIDLEAMGYPGVERRITVSMGLVIVTSSCHLTGREVESRAARAKHYAKQAGRNRIGSYTDPWFDQLVIAAP